MKSSARGLFTGNRGIIHDPDQKTLTGKRWSTTAWICCSLAWKGRQREVWGRNHVRPDGSKGPGWSELFFLDEVTALAAGHRPCYTCRNADAKAFHAAFCNANRRADAQAKNKILHAQRWHSSRTTPMAVKDLTTLPDASMVCIKGEFFAVREGGLLLWKPDGYAEPISTQGQCEAFLVTPPAIIGALKSGYQPVWHPTAL